MSVATPETWQATEYGRFVDERLVASPPEEIILLELADDDLDRADTTSGRTVFGGLLVSLLLHLWMMTNLAGWLLTEPGESMAPVIETNFADNVIHQEIEDAIPFELANPDERELEVREVTNAMSLGIAVVQNAPNGEPPGTDATTAVTVRLTALNS